MKRSVLSAFSVLFALMAVLAAASAALAADGELRPFKRGSWQQIRRAHEGRPIVVHFWGLTCGPCRVEMPKWGRLLEERSDLRLIAIDADLVPNAAELVKAELAKTGLAGAENWMFADDFVERLRFEINPRWRGEIPITLLIAGDGKMTTIEGAADSGEVRAWLDAQKAAPDGAPVR
jgi:thiol-disulfide isomerase/thioredoxin